MDGLPVTIRLLDPPLHEFLPRRRGARLEHAVGTRRRPEAELQPGRGALEGTTRCWAREACRLGIIKPGSTTCRCGRSSRPRGPRAHGRRSAVEIMIPLVAYAQGARAHARHGREEVAACWRRACESMLDRHDDRAPWAAIRGDLIAEGPTSSRSDERPHADGVRFLATTSPVPPRVSRTRDVPIDRSSPSTSAGVGSWCRWHGGAAKPTPISSSASVASTAATPTRSSSSRPPRLRVVLAVPRPGRARRCGAGGARRATRGGARRLRQRGRAGQGRAGRGGVSLSDPHEILALAKARVGEVVPGADLTAFAVAFSIVRAAERVTLRLETAHQRRWAGPGLASA